MEVLISFIIPVYNTQAYLKTCLDSILNQNFPSHAFEAICINDGSTDGSSAILHEYADQYSNVKVIDQKNAGVCAARNAGLRCAKGNYIWFVDSDDYISPNAEAFLSQTIASADADRIIIGNYRFSDGEDPCRDIEHRPKNTMWKDSSVWRNVFKKSFLDKNNLFFHSPELVYGEDALFMYEVKFAKPKTIEISEALYGYRDREGSASHSSSPEKTQRQLRSTIREAEIMRDYYESGREDSMTADRFMSFLYGALFHIAAMPQKTERERWLSYMRAAKLFPYRRPSACTISRSFQMNRGDLIEKIHDMIYIHLNTEIGFQAMYCWNVLFRIKKRLKSE